jgi:serine/threonine protein kinase
VHFNGVVHRDLKPQNILLDSSGFVKIVDFGTSDFICADTRTSTCAGTYYFMAPEVIALSKGQTYDPIAADIWSLGVTMFSLAFLQVPFQGKTLQELV